MNILKYNLYIIVLFSLWGCENRVTDKTDKQFIPEIQKVKTVIVQKSSFYTNINSNGKLESRKKVNLKFENPGFVESVKVKEGDFVKEGQIIACQSSSHILLEIERNKESLYKAYLNMEDILLGFGYSLKDSLKIPKETMDMVKSRSDISEFKLQIKLAQNKYNESRIKAPFSGIIADLVIKENSSSSFADKVCTLIDNQELEATFYILEKEFGKVSVEDSVGIYPIALPGKKFKGKVNYISPVVSENGLILIKANVENKENALIDGMNVNISIDNEIKDVISIPKKAVLDRQNRKVVFTLKNGKTQWNYVKLGQETIDSVIIIKGLKPLDQIIVEGNINLAHDTEVKLIN